MRLLRHTITAAAITCALSSCSPLADPVETGKLCFPATSPDCPDAVTLNRGTTNGRNAIDYRITNKTNKATRVNLVAGPAALLDDSTDTDMGGDEAPTATNTNASSLVFRERVLDPGEAMQDRLLPSELGRESNVRLQILCEPTGCSIQADYILIVEPLECTAKEDCLSGWECDTDRGQCLECIEGQGMCTEEQTCELGRCIPPQQSSCQTSPNARPTGPLPLWLLVLGLAARAGRRRSRRARCERSRPRRLPARAAALASAIAFIWPTTSHAAEPRAAMYIGAGTRVLTGELGQRSNLGFGLTLSQELRVRYIGMGLALSNASFVTTRAAQQLPYTSNFALYSAAIGPRAYIPLPKQLELSLSAGYERTGLAANSLVDLTGFDISRNGFFAATRLSYALAPLRFSAQVSYHVIPNLPGDLIQTTVSVGVGD